MNTWKRLILLLGTFGLVLTVFFLFIRPWYLQWGATDEEARRPLPGDEIVPDAEGQETRAITIDAPVDKVWPWLAQLGQDRGGFYSYDLLENIVGCEMPTEDRLRPDKQHWEVGDKLWMYPPEKAGGAGHATLRVHVQGRALGFGTRMTGTPLDRPENGSWSFILEPLTDSTTRMFIRGRGAGGRSLLGTAFDRSIFEPVHFTMERRMMIGIGELAEGTGRSHMANHLHVVLWTITFVMWIVAAVQVVRRRSWGRPLLGFIAASAIFQFLTLGQPPLIVGTLLVSSLGLLLWWRTKGRLA